MGHSHKHYHSKIPHVSRNPKDYPTGPAPETMKKTGFLGKLKSRLSEADATERSNTQLRLNVEREELKTKNYVAKHGRPSRLGNLVFGGPQQPIHHGRMPRQQVRTESHSLLDSGDRHSGGFLDSSASFGNGLNDLIGAGSSPVYTKKGKAPHRSGIEDMFT